MQQFQLSDPVTNARVVLTLALNGTDPEGRVPVVLDIDAFKLTNIPPKDPSIWDEMLTLKKLKNDCFFGTLTDKAKELYA